MLNFTDGRSNPTIVLEGHVQTNTSNCGSAVEGPKCQVALGAEQDSNL